jgi:hypothetical protein
MPPTAESSSLQSEADTIASSCDRWVRSKRRISCPVDRTVLEQILKAESKVPLFGVCDSRCSGAGPASDGRPIRKPAGSRGQLGGKRSRVGAVWGARGQCHEVVARWRAARPPKQMGGWRQLRASAWLLARIAEAGPDVAGGGGRAGRARHASDYGRCGASSSTGITFKLTPATGSRRHRSRGLVEGASGPATPGGSVHRRARPLPRQALGQHDPPAWPLRSRRSPVAGAARPRRTLTFQRRCARNHRHRRADRRHQLCLCRRFGHHFELKAMSFMDNQQPQG